MVRQQYRDFYDGQDIGNELAERITELLVEDRMLSSNWVSGPLTHVVSAADVERRSEIERELEATMSASAFAALKVYQGAIDIRFSLRGLESQLATAGVPLRSEQKEQLVEVVNSERHTIDQYAPAATDASELARQTVLRQDRWDELVEHAAKNILTVSQQEIATSYFTYRKSSRHRALEQYQVQVSEGRTTIPFSYVLN
jgi:hypothetical protein